MKSIFLSIVTLLIVLSLGGCSIDDTSSDLLGDHSEITTTTPDATTSQADSDNAQTESRPDEILPEGTYDEAGNSVNLLKAYAQTVLEQITTKDFNYNAEYYYLSEGEYVQRNFSDIIFREEYWDSIDITSYAVTDITTSDFNHVVYTVTLDISKSNNELFRVGKSEWILDLLLDEYEIAALFYPKGQPYESVEGDNRVITAAQRMLFGSFIDTRESFYDFSQFISEEPLSDDEYVSFFTNAVALLALTGEKSLYSDYTTDEVTNFAQIIMGCEFPQHYKDFLDNNYGWNYTWYPYTVSHSRITDYSYTEEFGIYEVYADIYSDSLSIDTASTIKFSFKDGKDGLILFEGVEFIYDNRAEWYRK